MKTGSITPKHFDTLAGRIGVQSPNTGGTDVVLALLPYVHLVLPMYADALGGAKDDRRGSIALVKVEGLEGLAGLLHNDTCRVLPWEVQQPPLLIEQLITNYISGDDFVLHYEEALSLLRQHADFNAAQALLKYANDKGIRTWDAEKELKAEGKISSRTATSVAKQIYTNIFRPLGESTKIKNELEDILTGKPFGTVRRETLEFLAEEVDKRFDITSTDEYGFVSFVQRAAAKALADNKDPRSDNKVEYQDKELSEAWLVSRIRQFFTAVRPPYGAAFLFETNKERILAETAKLVPFSELSSLPEEVAAGYRPLEDLYKDFVILTQILYCSVFEHVRSKHPSDSELIAALTLRSMLPLDEYFPSSFRAFRATDRRNNTHRASAIKLSFPGPEDSASTIVRQIKDGGVPTLLPYKPYCPNDLALLDVRGAAIMLYEHLPRELLDAMRMGEQLATMSRFGNREIEKERRTLVAARSSLQEGLNTDFGCDIFKLPAFSKKPEKGRVEETLHIYFGISMNAQ